MTKIIFITDTTTAGRGDYDYLQALSNESFLSRLGINDNFEILRVVCVNSKNDTLIKKGASSSPVTQDDVKIDPEAEKVRVIVYDSDLDLSPKLASVFSEDEFAKADYLICVSVGGLLGQAKKYKQKNPETELYFIGAHSSHIEIGRGHDGIKQFQIGPSDGFLMERIVSPLVKSQRIKALSEIEDEDYRQFLLKGKEIDEFLDKTLFVPAYLQHTQHVKVFVRGIVSSTLDESYPDGLIFHLSLHEDVKTDAAFQSPQEIYKSLFDDKIETLRRKGYTQILIDGFSGDADYIINLSSEKQEDYPKKTVRVISNRWMQNKSDFDRLFGAAQYIAGTSGDNSLNNALAKGVIPFYSCQQWNQFFLPVYKNFIIKCAQELGIKKESRECIRYFLDAIMPVFFQSQFEVENKERLERCQAQFTQALNDIKNQKLFIKIKRIIDYIQRKHNFFDTMRDRIIGPIITAAQKKIEASQVSSLSPSVTELSIFSPPNLVQKDKEESRQEEDAEETRQEPFSKND